MTDKPSETEVRQALARIVAHAGKRALDYAIGYAKAGQVMTGETLRVQCLSVLSNITHWRGDEAKTVRGLLKRFAQRQK